MAQPVIQSSFNSGEWSPNLNARVDLAKYHSGAALLRNYFVDYRGGASTRPGTKYILQAYKSSSAVRLIPFQASFTVSYALEFGDFYIRFYNAGAPILEATFAISGATQANPAVLTIVGNNYSIGDWIYVAAVVGMTQLNGHYFSITNVVGNAVTIANLNGAAINSSAYTAYSSGGTSARVYTLPSPYAAADLALLKYAQNVNTLVICHPSYPPYILTLVAATNWTLSSILFGTSIGTPTGVVAATTLGAGAVFYSYLVTAVDVNGQESGSSTPATLASKLDLRTVAGTNTITWTAVTGAQSYNVYKAEPSYTGAVPAGAVFGYIGNARGVQLDDSNIEPDFSITPPIPQNPFQGAGVASITVTTRGSYTAVPTATLAAAPSGGSTATASVILQLLTYTISNPGNFYSVGDITSNPTYGISLVVASVAGGQITAFQPFTYPGSNAGSLTTGAIPATVNLTPTVGTGTTMTIATTAWEIKSIQLISHGAGYVAVPAVTISLAGGGAATAVLGTASNGNPSVPSYFQQRLVLAGPPGNPQQFNMSQPGSYFNFDIHSPVQDDDAIQGTIVSGQLNSIKSLLSMSIGLIILSDRQAWLINGGGANTAITPADATAQSQSYNGASDVPPILSNFDILYVQAKGSYARDLTFNFYTNIYTGTDISVLSSHLFYGYTLTEWAWAEEPFKLVNAVRSDGTMLVLTFLKEQEFVAWTHYDTTGLFKSVCAITEAALLGAGSVDAVYTVVQRVINSNTVKYIERFAERIYPNGVTDAWTVDAGLQYSGAPATSFTGGEHLAGATVTGLADGLVITPFVMPLTGNFTLAAASKVTVGLAYTPDLQTLAIDLSGTDTVQSKEKQIPAVTLRVAEALGLSIGSTFANVVAMKDLVVGNVGSMTNAVITGLVTGDARTIIDADYTVPGQYCIRQSNPFPATILGVMPQITVGDTKAEKQ